MGITISTAGEGLRGAARRFGGSALCRLRLPLPPAGDRHPRRGFITRSSEKEVKGLLILGFPWWVTVPVMVVFGALLWYVFGGWVPPLVRVPLVIVLAPACFLVAIVVAAAFSAVLSGPYEPPDQRPEKTTTTTPAPSTGPVTTGTPAASPTASPSPSPTASPAASPSPSPSPSP
jgi:hypothetical protein